MVMVHNYILAVILQQMIMYIIYIPKILCKRFLIIISKCQTNYEIEGVLSILPIEEISRYILIMIYK